MKTRCYQWFAWITFFAGVSFGLRAEDPDHRSVAEFLVNGYPIEIISTPEAIQRANARAPYVDNSAANPPPLEPGDAVTKAWESFNRLNVTDWGRKKAAFKSVSLTRIYNSASAWVYLVEFWWGESFDFKTVVMMDGSTLPVRVKGRSAIFEELTDENLDQVLHGRSSIKE
tara:strand:+ start:581 stop:1093 length:513 start_codon:yes stop_codon:yes gene_type:complete